LVGERPTGTLGKAGPRASCGQEMVSGGIRPHKRTPPDLHRPNRAWREEHQLWKSVEDFGRARGDPIGTAIRAGRRRCTRDGIKSQAETQQSEDRHCGTPNVRDREAGAKTKAPICCDGPDNSGARRSDRQGCSNTKAFSWAPGGRQNTRPEEVTSSPDYAASTASFRTAVNRTLIDIGPSLRASRATRHALTVALVKPSRGSSVYSARIDEFRSALPVWIRERARLFLSHGGDLRRLAAHDDFPAAPGRLRSSFQNFHYDHVIPDRRHSGRL
jgi:hypothetical protein